MVSDQEIVNGVESLLRQSNPIGVTSLNGVVEQLEAKLGLDLSHKTGFIRDLLSGGGGGFRVLPPPQPKDHFALQHFPQFQHMTTTTTSQQFPSHFALPHHHHHPEELNFRYPPQSHLYHQYAAQQQQHPQRSTAAPTPQAVKSDASPSHPHHQNQNQKKDSAPAATKRRGGPGGLNKVCGVSPELEAIVGEPALPRTQIVKQLWAYIRKHNLQDPSNKRKIICNDALRLVFETDCTDMFKMNKLLAKHIIPLDPTKELGSDSKRLKVETESATENTEAISEVTTEAVSKFSAEAVSTEATVESSSPPVMISEALARFFDTEEKEMPQSEAVRRLWEHIKTKQLEDDLNPMTIMCDSKLQELFGCENFSALEIAEMLMAHFFKQS